MESWPKISIVTPCLNQAKYVAATMESVHGQDYPNLEHIVADGGSTDGSLEIIKRYADRVRWTSQKDSGQYAAIEAGLNSSSGEILGWLNSDDIYLPGALRTVGAIFRDLPQVEWITTRFPIGIDAGGALIKQGCFPGFSLERFRRGDFLPSSGWEAFGFIQQESTFWRRSLWVKAGGGFAKEFPYAGDFELWSRFIQLAPLHGVDVPLAGFRRHESQKTTRGFEKYVAEARRAFAGAGARQSPTWWQTLRIRTERYLAVSAEFRRRARRLGFLRDVRNLTYDWGSGRWIYEP